jgi:hypothetical protein
MATSVRVLAILANLKTDWRNVPSNSLLETVHEDPTFPSEYRCIAYFASESMTHDKLGRVRELVASVLGEDCYFGISLGKYEFVADFKSESALVASFKVKDLESLVRTKVGLRCSASVYLCKEILCGKALSKVRTPLRAYIFVRSSEEVFPIETFKTCVSGMAESLSSNTVLWNTTAYSAIIPVDGANVQDIISSILDLRKTAGGIISDSSTLIAIGFDEKGLAQDSKIEPPIPCTIYVKVRNFENNWLNEETNIGTPIGNLGWFDLAFTKSFSSVNQLVEAILAFREQHEEDISQLSAVIQSNKGFQ